MTLQRGAPARYDGSDAGVQFTSEFFMLLFGEHKFVANESAALRAGVNDIHLASLRAIAKQSRSLLCFARWIASSLCAPRNDDLLCIKTECGRARSRSRCD